MKAEDVGPNTQWYKGAEYFSNLEGMQDQNLLKSARKIKSSNTTLDEIDLKNYESMVRKTKTSVLSNEEDIIVDNQIQSYKTIKKCWLKLSTRI